MPPDPTTEAPQDGDALAGKLKRTELQRARSSIPGRQIVQVLTEIPEGVESGWHMHPGEEVGYGQVIAAEDDRLDIMFETSGEKRVLDRFVERHDT